MAAKGMNCVLTVGAVTIGKAKDFDPDYTAEEIDMTVRDSSGWVEREQGLKSWAASAVLLWVPTNEGVTALWNAYANGSTVTVEWTDADGYGRSGSAIVTQFKPGPQGLTDAVMVTVGLTSTGAVTSVTPSS